MKVEYKLVLTVEYGDVPPEPEVVGRVVENCTAGEAIADGLAMNYTVDYASLRLGGVVETRTRALMDFVRELIESGRISWNDDAPILHGILEELEGGAV